MGAAERETRPRIPVAFPVQRFAASASGLPDLRFEPAFLLPPQWKTPLRESERP